MRRLRSSPLAVIQDGDHHNGGSGINSSAATWQTEAAAAAAATKTPPPPTTATFLLLQCLSLAANLLLLILLLATWSKLHVLNNNNSSSSSSDEATLLRHENIKLRHDVQTWHGGHPAAQHQGSCWCNHNNDNEMNQYCMCTPNVAIDLIVLVENNNNNQNHHYDVWLARRKDTGQYATVGGFVMLGESVEQAVFRELKEETGFTQADMRSIPPELVGVYSDPQRDNRRHTLSVVYAIHLLRNADHDTAKKKKGYDDVKQLIRVPLQDIEKYDFFADHQTILLDYRQRLHLLEQNNNNKKKRTRSGNMVIPASGVFPANVQRSICDSLV